MSPAPARVRRTALVPARRLIVDARYADVTERDFQASVRELARVCGWRVYATHDSRRSPAGFPDLVMVHKRSGRIIFAELKSERGRATREQLDWLADLERHACDGVTVALWRPSDWPTIEATLARGGRP